MIARARGVVGFIPMFRARGENLRSIYILLFLSVAFFLLEYQDEPKFARLFSFDLPSVMNGDVWRLVTWQFTQAGQGWFFFPKPVALFFTLLILYIMGAAIEEEWGTRHFLTLFFVSTLVSAGAAAWLGVPILGAYFVNFTLLFVYALVYPEQTFYLLGIVPIRVRWLAYLAAALLLLGVVFGGKENTAALMGAAAGFGYALVLTAPVVRKPAAVQRLAEPEVQEDPEGATAVRNAARFVAIKRALANGSEADVDRLVAQCEREIVRGVNICPPADYKPEHSDGYCIRCEGFAECSARFLRQNRPQKTAEAQGFPEPTT